MPDQTSAITTRALTKSYGSVTILHPLTIDIPKGEVFGFLGHNGAGKTTTIRLLTTLLEPSGGEATVAGHDLWTDPMGLRAAIGYLPENVRLYDRFTTRENLTFFGRLSGVTDVVDRVEETLSFLGIKDIADRRVATFSNGMRQRVGLAQAILHQPDLLFLDEPTSGLDPMGVRLLREIIERLNTGGMTIFMNTHLLSEVARTLRNVIEVASVTKHFERFTFAVLGIKDIYTGKPLSVIWADKWGDALFLFLFTAGLGGLVLLRRIDPDRLTQET